MTYKLIFTASNGTLGYELYTTDGSGLAAELVGDLFPGASNGLGSIETALLGETVFFLGNDGVAGFAAC